MGPSQKRRAFFLFYTDFFPIPIEYLLSSLFQSFICLILLPYSTARADTVLVNKEVFRVEHKYQGSLTYKRNQFLAERKFPVVNSEFKEDPHWAAAFAAYEWIQQIQNVFGSSKDFRIDKVVYNRDNNITELIKKGRPIIEDDLPF
ncbi:hypothetical protein NGI46_25390 [Peribacillus butanolivorans]|nr:hypothetical protein [Peribacillus butanolivorans]